HGPQLAPGPTASSTPKPRPDTRRARLCIEPGRAGGCENQEAARASPTPSPEATARILCPCRAQSAIGGLAEPRRIRENGLEYPLKIAWRAADDAQNLGSCLLPLQRLPQLAGDHRLPLRRSPSAPPESGHHLGRHSRPLMTLSRRRRAMFQGEWNCGL